MRLLPGNSNNRIIIISRIPEIIFHIRLVVSQFAPPNQGIGKRHSHNSSVAIKSIIEPIKIFAIVYISYFSFINIERVDTYAAGNIIPIAHYIIFFSTHHKSTSLHKNKARPRFLLLRFKHMKITIIFIIVIPTCYGRFIFFLAKNTTVFTRG